MTASSLVLVLSILSLALWGPLSDPDMRAQFRVDEQSRAERELLALIPPGAGVVASDRFAAALSTRQRTYTFGGPFDQAYPLDYLVYEDTPVGYPPHQPALLGPPTEGGWQVPRYDIVGSAGQTELRHRVGMVEAARVPASVQFGDALALRGATGYGQVLRVSPGEPLEVALVWEALRGDLPRLVTFVHLVERRPEGEYRWASVDHEVYNGLFPTNWWQAGATTAGQPKSSTEALARDRPDLVGDVWTLVVPPWLPPGQYELHVGLYTREGMQRLLTSQGTTHFAATVDVALARASEGPPPDIPVPVALPVAAGFTLLGHNPIPESAAAGQTLDATLLWQASGAISSDYDLRFDLVAEGGAEPAESWTLAPLPGRYGTALWPPGAGLAAWHPLLLPASLPLGEYHLHVTALDGAEPAGQTVELATVQITSAD